jgi:hypothetical protein
MSKNILLKDFTTREIIVLMVVSIISGISSFWLMCYCLKDVRGSEWYIVPTIITEMFYLLLLILFNVACNIEIRFERKDEELWIVWKELPQHCSTQNPCSVTSMRRFIYIYLTFIIVTYILNIFYYLSSNCSGHNIYCLIGDLSILLIKYVCNIFS